MELRVLGCHGGETPRHRTTSFLLDDRVGLDAGAITSRLELPEQARIEGVLVSHAHMDHIRDLATLADNRCQLGAPPLLVAGTGSTLKALRQHFFNDTLWPDFSAIPSRDQPTIVYRELPLETPVSLLGFEVLAVPVNHTIDAAGFIVSDATGAVAFSGDTGPTDRLFELLRETPNLRALLMEVSFPDRLQALATMSGHHTPQTLAVDLAKLAAPRDLATYLYHIKPPFQAEVERECAALRGLNLEVLALDRHLRL
ncbi:MAG: 3',5'-cyclic-nucleotide phosphodiesterase [Deltaproteobacteria bacterium]|nr:3',5'-cyclic-nucleotide phosphodiesterase [Deltaproteobacteria bacterium]